MKNELLNIADYLESLEERIATLDARVIELESKVSELEKAPSVGFPVEGQPAEESPEQPESPAQPEQSEQVDIQLEQEMKMATIEARLIELESKAEEAPSVGFPVEGQPAAQPAATINAPKVDDIRHAISLGDRFLFQRELFGQNGEQMQKTLEALNELPDLDNALAYLDKHFGSWDKDSTAYQLFYTVLQRRF